MGKQLMAASDLDTELEELRRKSVGRLISAEVFDVSAFSALKAHICEKAELIKAEHVVSKQVVACLLEAASVIESRAAYVEGAKNNAHLANDFRMVLALIAAGEGCNDRKPGVPRVV
jgi:hypothetical protein